MPAQDIRTANFDLPLIDSEHTLEESRLRLDEAITTISLRLQEIVNQTQSPDAGTLGGEDLAFILSLANVTGVLPVSKGGTGATDATGARAALGIDAAWDVKFAAALNVAPEQLNTIQEIVAEIQDNDSAIAAINTVLASKAAQTALDAVDIRVTTAEAELDVVLPDGASGTFTPPRYTTAARDALDMTGKPAGREIYNTTTNQKEAWDGVNTWGPVSSGLYESGDFAIWAGNVAPPGWTRTGYAGPHFPAITRATFSTGGSFGFKLTDRYLVSVGGAQTEGGSIGVLIDTTDWSVTVMASLPSDWRVEGFCPVANGKLLIFGGTNWYGSTVVNRTAIYDPETNTIDEAGVAAMPSARRSPLSCPLTDGRVVVLGGYTQWNAAEGTAQRQIWLYDPAGNSWSTLVPALTPAYFRYNGVITQYDADTLWVSGGNLSGSTSNQYTVYSIALADGTVTGHGDHTELSDTSYPVFGYMNLDGTLRNYHHRSNALYSVDLATNELISIPAPTSGSSGSLMQNEGQSFYRINSSSVVEYFFGIMIQKDTQ